MWRISKIYHTFMSNLSPSDNFLMIELRTRFGSPGETAPDCAQVLTFLRGYQERIAPRVTVNAAASVVHSSEEAVADKLDYDKLASLMVEKMKVSNLPSPSLPPPRRSYNPVPGSQSTPRPPAPRPQSNSHRGPGVSSSDRPCSKCGDFGHWKADCPNAPNPSKVRSIQMSLKNRGKHSLNFR